MTDHREVVDRAHADGVKFVSLQFMDVAGAIKNVTIPVTRLDEAFTRGVWFDGSSIEGFARIYESDMFLNPDAGTYRVLPWGSEDQRVARVICDVHLPDGDPFPGDPRHTLKRALAQAKERGYTYNIGAELEFFLFKPNNDVTPLEPVPHDVGGYFDFSPRDQAARVREDITLALAQMGIEVEAAHHEVAEGQHEIDFEYADALTSADNCVTFKYTVKAIAQRHNLYATFMPKPIAGINGSGMHTHQSLFNAAGENAFYDPDGDPYRLSQLARSFVAGQLDHAPALAAIVAPTVNSYKRLVPGYEAPVYICWGQVNRSALVRIPRYSPGREQSTRVELRFPDPSCNPYLAFATMLMAGLDGIDRDLNPPDPLEESAYELTAQRMAELGVNTLPASLGQALRALHQDDVIRAAVGDHAYQAFARARRAEWDAYRIQVTRWELDRYLEAL